MTLATPSNDLPPDNGNVVTDIDPSSIHRIHLVGVAGTGMGAFAGMLKAAGYTVTGSDENVYPPMSDMLRAWDIETYTPYSAENLDFAQPDLVIIGNVIRRVNPEATAVRERGIRQMSFPSAFGALIVDRDQVRARMRDPRYNTASRDFDPAFAAETERLAKERFK